MPTENLFPDQIAINWDYANREFIHRSNCHIELEIMLTENSFTDQMPYWTWDRANREFIHRSNCHIELQIMPTENLFPNQMPYIELEIMQTENLFTDQIAILNLRSCQQRIYSQIKLPYWTWDYANRELIHRSNCHIELEIMSTKNLLTDSIGNRKFTHRTKLEKMPTENVLTGIRDYIFAKAAEVPTENLFTDQLPY